MCCSASHYPRHAGVWRCDDDAMHVHSEGGVVEGDASRCNHEWDHHHLVLPGPHYLCIFNAGHALVLSWHMGEGVAADRVTRSYCQLEERTYSISLVPLAERLALGVIEGGHCSKEWAEAMAKEWGGEVGAEMALSPEIGNHRGGPLDVPRDMDYAEWLVRQQVKEAEVKLGRAEPLLWTPKWAQ